MFDREHALLAVINVFWTRGYEGTSVKNLTETIGNNAPSLYAEFGDKHELYLQAIHRYANNDACAPLVALEQIEGIHAAVRAFLDAAIDYSTDHDSGAKGCFLASCVSMSAGYVEGVTELLHEAITATDAHITARFDLEKKSECYRAAFPELNALACCSICGRVWCFVPTPALAQKCNQRIWLTWFNSLLLITGSESWADIGIDMQAAPIHRKLLD